MYFSIRKFFYLYLVWTLTKVLALASEYEDNEWRMGMAFDSKPENQNKSLKWSERKTETVLHRQKRYLLFPEGSSFQLVFDLIIPIVDYTNFAIMGITCAVAWELPSKPASEIVENLRQKLLDGTLGLSRRVDQGAVNYQERPLYQDQTPISFDPTKFNLLYPNVGPSHSLVKQIPRRKEVLTGPPLHRIYPVYGRRRRRSLGQDYRQIQLNSHLRSREKFFHKFAQIYQLNGFSGACVLKLICKINRAERFQRKSPNNFLSELLRAVFLLPRHSIFAFNDTEYQTQLLESQMCDNEFLECFDQFV